MNNNKKYQIYLDDVRTPIGDWVIVRNYKQFFDTILNMGLNNVELISFDHDLADEHYRPSMYNLDGHYSNYYTNGTFKEKTGFDCAKFLIDYCLDNEIDMPQVNVHSMNPVGSKNITSIIDQFYEKTNKDMKCTRVFVKCLSENWY